MEIKRIYEGGNYKGSVTTRNNGDKVWRDSKGNRVATYDKSTNSLRNSSGRRITFR